MEYDDLWPVSSHESQLLLTQTECQLSLRHVSPEERVKTGPGSAQCDRVSLLPLQLVRRPGWRKWVWSLMMIIWLTGNPFVSGGLSHCLQRRWREHWRTEGPFHWRRVQVLLVSCRYAHTHIKTTPKLALILQVWTEMSLNLKRLASWDRKPGLLCQTAPHLSGCLPLPSSLQHTFCFFFFFFLLPLLCLPPMPLGPHCPAALVVLCSTWFQT